MPIGAVVGNEKTWSKYVENPFLHTTTFGGNPLSCAAAIATISILLDEDLPAQAKAKGDYMIPRMNELVKRYPDVMKEIRGVGLMLGMEFTGNDTGYEVAKHLFARNILISGTYINSKCLRVEPPLTISYEQIDTFLKALEESVAEVSKSAKSGLAPAIS
ncbi:MAG: Putrescine aminotransferase [bacterium ADurb.Bin425]|nr:MAG: Putrescine aminotransferase [bacterium ADurb.Bin425]